MQQGQPQPQVHAPHAACLAGNALAPAVHGHSAQLMAAAMQHQPLGAHPDHTALSVPARSQAALLQHAGSAGASTGRSGHFSQLHPGCVSQPPPRSLPAPGSWSKLPAGQCKPAEGHTQPQYDTPAGCRPANHAAAAQAHPAPLHHSAPPLVAQAASSAAAPADQHGCGQPATGTREGGAVAAKSESKSLPGPKPGQPTKAKWALQSSGKRKQERPANITSQNMKRVWLEDERRTAAEEEQRLREAAKDTYFGREAQYAFALKNTEMLASVSCCTF